MDTIKTATAAPPHPAESKVAAANEGFLQGEGGKQQLLLRQQDEQLEDIESAVSRLGRVGLTIHEELKSQVCARLVRVWVHGVSVGCGVCGCVQASGSSVWPSRAYVRVRASTNQHLVRTHVHAPTGPDAG